MARCFSVSARSGSVLYRSERRNNSTLSRLRLGSKSSARAPESFALHFDLAYRPVTERLPVRKDETENSPTSGIFVLEEFKVGELRQVKTAREVEGSRFRKLGRREVGGFRTAAKSLAWRSFQGLEKQKGLGVAKYLAICRASQRSVFISERV